MKIGRRLYITVIPAVLGVILVAALGYWGEYSRDVPGVIVGLAGVAALASLWLAWRNTRYVAERIERLAGGTGAPEPTQAHDELETIERVVDNLSTEASAAREAGAESQRAAEARVAEYAALLSETSAGVARRLEEVRLPLHILLDSRFGDLNDNQEEMIAAARRAAEDAEAALQRLREIADLDRGALKLRRDEVRLGEMLNAILPTLRALAARAGAQITLEVAPGRPRILGDTARLREALVKLIGQRAEAANPGDTVSISLEHGREATQLVIRHSPMTGIGAEEILARRIIEAHDGRVRTTGGSTEVTMPVMRQS